MTEGKMTVYVRENESPRVDYGGELYQSDMVWDCVWDYVADYIVLERLGNHSDQDILAEIHRMVDHAFYEANHAEVNVRRAKKEPYTGVDTPEHYDPAGEELAPYADSAGRGYSELSRMRNEEEGHVRLGLDEDDPLYEEGHDTPYQERSE